MKVWQTFKNAPLKSIKSYIEGNVRMLQEKLGEGILSLEPHIVEQVVFREEKSKCKGKTACDLCGCAIPGLFYADKACQGGCYPEMMNQTDWELFKQNKKAPLNYSVHETQIGADPVIVEGHKNESVKSSFLLKNLGQKTFNLEKISVSCGCTVPQWTKGTQIEPGQSIVIPFTIEMAAETTKAIFVTGNAPILTVNINRKFV